MGADASATCTVMRNDVGVDWKKRDIKSTFVEHTAILIKHELTSLSLSALASKATSTSTTKDDDKDESNKPRKPKPLSASTSSTDDSSDETITAITISEVKKAEEVVGKSKNTSMNDDHDAVNIHVMKLVLRCS